MNNLGNPVIISVPNVIAQSGLAQSVTGTTSELVLATIPIPAGVLLAHGRIRLWFTTTSTNNANVKTVKAKLNGSVIGAAAVITSTGTQVYHVDVVNGTNRTTNYGQIAFTAGSAASQTGAALNVDTTQPLVVTITGQLATGTDNITLNAYSLETLNP